MNTPDEVKPNTLGFNVNISTTRSVHNRLSKLEIGIDIVADDMTRVPLFDETVSREARALE
jgi:hypothetical protein